MRIVLPLVGGNTMPSVVAWASRALAVDNAEQAASRSKAADPLELSRPGSVASIPSYLVEINGSSGTLKQVRQDVLSIRRGLLSMDFAGRGRRRSQAQVGAGGRCPAIRAFALESRFEGYSICEADRIQKSRCLIAHHQH